MPLCKHLFLSTTKLATILATFTLLTWANTKDKIMILTFVQVCFMHLLFIWF